MKIQSVSIDSVMVDPANVRLHPERNMETIKASLARFGQQKPLVVDGDNIVRAGNGTLEAARALGWSDIKIIRTPLKGSEATAYAIADNRSSELAEWDDTALATTLRALQSEEFDLGAVGYDDDELSDLLADLANGALDLAASEEIEPGEGLKTIAFTLSPVDYELVIGVLDRVREDRKCNPSEALLYVIRAFES
jgi:ParB-like chromosome segregation protein Spo0J